MPFTRPVPQPVTSVFGDMVGRMRKHAGVDYAAPPGTPVLAAYSGRASYHWDAALGSVVEVEGTFSNGLSPWLARLLGHPQGRQTTLRFRVAYAHLEAERGRFPRSVGPQEVIGWTGNTGAETTGPHLHATVSLLLPDGRWALIDPGLVYPGTSRGASPALDPATRNPA